MRIPLLTVLAVVLAFPLATAYAAEIAVPENLGPQELMRLAEAYQNHGIVRPILPYLKAAIARAKDPASRGQLATGGLSLLQILEQREDGKALIDHALGLELSATDRAALRLRRVTLFPVDTPLATIEPDLLAAASDGDANVADEARFRLILRWQQAGLIDPQAERLAASSKPEDKLMLAHLLWTAKRNRQGAAVLYKEWLDSGQWHDIVVDRLESQYRAQGDQAALDALLRKRWREAKDAAGRRRAAESMLEAYVKAGTIDGELTRWKTAQEGGKLDPLETYLLAHKTEKDKPDTTEPLWNAVLAARPDLSEVLELVLAKRIMAGDWTGALKLISNARSATIPVLDRMNMLSSAINRAKEVPPDIVQQLEGLLREDEGNELLAGVAIRLYRERQEFEKLGQLSVRLVDQGKIEPELVQDAVAWATEHKDDARLARYIEIMSNGGAEGISNMTLAMARRALKAGNAEDVRKWGTLTILHAGYDTWLPAVHNSVGLLFKDAGLLDDAVGVLQQGLAVCITGGEAATVIEIQARLCLDEDRPLEAARLAWQALAEHTTGGPREETYHFLLHRAGDAFLKQGAPPKPEGDPLFPESVKHDAAQVTLRMYYSDEFEHAAKAVEALAAIGKAFGDRVHAVPEDLYRYESFGRLLNTEADLGFAPLRNTVLIQAGGDTGAGQEGLEYLDSVLAGKIALSRAGYKDGKAPATETPADGPGAGTKPEDPKPGQTDYLAALAGSAYSLVALVALAGIILGYGLGRIFVPRR